MDRREFCIYLNQKMNEYRIKQQELANILNVSQKTVSRYMRDEVGVPDTRQVQIKNYFEQREKEDAKLQELFEQNTDDYFPFDQDFTIGLGELELMAEHEQQMEQIRSLYFKYTPEGQEYILRQLDWLLEFEMFEVDMVMMFSQLLDAEKDRLVEFLKKYSISYENINQKSICFKKIQTCMKIIDEAKTKPFYPEAKSYYVSNSSCERWDEVENKIMTNTYLCDYDHYFFLANSVIYSSYDWYFLLLLEILQLNDDESTWIGKRGHEGEGRITKYVYDYMDDLLKKRGIGD